ncbi:hypothetical protein SNEBB_006693 [Seison nebaliae]|nr:hypothetical protein SNEBB_006693 [Seison nebaliae]
MTTPARRRLVRDFKRLSTDLPYGTCAFPLDDDIFQWKGVIYGPKGTSFENGVYELQMQFSENYPDIPPHVTFITPIFHPNIYTNGDICLDVLQNRWVSSYDIIAILASLQSLLDEPNPLSPANVKAAHYYMHDRLAYEREVRRNVEISWICRSGHKLVNPLTDQSSSNTTITTTTTTTTST